MGFSMGTMARSALGQAVPATTLEIDVENTVNYVEDTLDFTRLATNRNITPASLQPTFASIVSIGDIVAVNGRAAKGTFTAVSRRVNLTAASTLGQALADITRPIITNSQYEILTSDGGAIGTIMCQGFGGGAAPSGSPSTQIEGNQAVTGGTGAFAGIWGTCGVGTAPNPVANRTASMVEDPASRRVNGGGRGRHIVSVNPFSTSNVPTVTVAIVSPSSVKQGSSYSATVFGTNLSDKTYFDIKYRAPGSTTDVEALNWQKGVTSSHPVSSDTTLGAWTITAIRPHENENDHITGSYFTVSVTILVTQ
jgi:hypothetical protein